MTKEKKSKLNVDDPEETIIETEEKQATYEERCRFLNPIAQPLASRKLTKKVYKLIKKYAKKPQFFSGLKDVQKQLRLGTEGIVILAGDVLPIDIYSHLPAVCEEKNVPYCYVPSKDDIGAAMGVKRSVITVFLGVNPELKENYNEIAQDIKALPIPFQ